jgi:isopenicillin-N epimerase
MIGAMASLPLSEMPPSLQDDLFHHDKIEVPLLALPPAPSRCLRVSAQLYNTANQYEHLADALSRHLG